MTTYYVDLVNGNDSNDGSTFALRKKTITSAISGASLNDTVRVMASPAATNTGINATWTNGSATVTLASALSATIDNCESAWTASANVTATAATSPVRQGTYAASLAIASAFTTGLVAYKALGAATDFSGYQQISLLIRANNAVTAGWFTLSLCSDTAGVTAVNTITLPALSGGYWTKVTIDTAGALGSSIQSVALNAVSDPGTITVYLDNIIACKASSAVDSLTHRSLISKGGANDPWFAIESINGTTVTLAGQTADIAALSSTIAGKYWGSTETVALYKREPITLSAAVNVNRAVSSGDPNSNMLLISGGWNTTDMSTQVDRTYLRQADSSVHLMTVRNGMTKLQSFGSSDSLSLASLIYTSQVFISDCLAAGCYYGVSSTGTGDLRLSLAYCVGCRYGFYLDGNFTDSSWPSSVYAGLAWGISNYITDTNYFVSSTPSGYPQLTVECPDIRNFNNGCYSSGASSPTLKNCVFTGNYRDFTSFCDIYAFNCTFADNTLASGILLPNRATLYATRLAGDSAQGGQATGSFGRILMATDQRHTASDVSWKFISAANNLYLNYSALSLNVASIACPANETRTVTLWFRRDNASSAMRLRVKGGFTPGIANDVVANMSAAANTWEQLSISFTPTANAVVPIYAEFAGATNNLGWVDDLGVS